LTAAIANFQAQFKPTGASLRSDAIKAPQDQIKR